MRRCKDYLGEQISDSQKWRRLNGWLVIVWALVLPVSIITAVVQVLEFTAILSVYANLVTHMGVWAGARAEAKQEE